MLISMTKHIFWWHSTKEDSFFRRCFQNHDVILVDIWNLETDKSEHTYATPMTSGSQGDVNHSIRQSVSGKINCSNSANFDACLFTFRSLIIPSFSFKISKLKKYLFGFLVYLSCNICLGFIICISSFSVQVW